MNCANCGELQKPRKKKGAADSPNKLDVVRCKDLFEQILIRETGNEVTVIQMIADIYSAHEKFIPILGSDDSETRILCYTCFQLVFTTYKKKYSFSKRSKAGGFLHQYMPWESINLSLDVDVSPSAGNNVMKCDAIVKEECEESGACSVNMPSVSGSLTIGTLPVPSQVPEPEQIARKFNLRDCSIVLEKVVNSPIGISREFNRQWHSKRGIRQFKKVRKPVLTSHKTLRKRKLGSPRISELSNLSESSMRGLQLCARSYLPPSENYSNSNSEDCPRVKVKMDIFDSDHSDDEDLNDTNHVEHDPLEIVEDVKNDDTPSSSTKNNTAADIIQQHDPVQQNQLSIVVGFKCCKFYCKFESLSKEVVYAHQLNNHLGVEREDPALAKCFICLESGRGPGWSNHHMLNVHVPQAVTNDKSTEKNDPQKCEFACKLCDYSTINRFLMQLHNQRFHEGASSMDCTLCGKSFDSKVKLSLHKSVVHKVQHVAASGATPRTVASTPEYVSDLGRPVTPASSTTTSTVLYGPVPNLSSAMTDMRNIDVVRQFANSIATLRVPLENVGSDTSEHDAASPASVELLRGPSVPELVDEILSPVETWGIEDVQIDPNFDFDPLQLVESCLNDSPNRFLSFE